MATAQALTAGRRALHGIGTQKARQAAITRSPLVAVGRRLFAERGFAGTSTEEIVVHEQVTAVAMASSQAWPGPVAGCAAVLDACLAPATQRIGQLAPSEFAEAWTTRLQPTLACTWTHASGTPHYGVLPFRSRYASANSRSSASDESTKCCACRRSRGSA